MNKIKEILEKVYIVPELRKTIIPLFVGDPGNGKSHIIQQFADDKGVKLVEIIASQVNPYEVSGIAMPNKETKKMTYFNFDNLEDLVDGDILFFDELLTANPIVINACLTLLEQRKFISGKKLPNIMIVAAGNPQQRLPMSPAAKERFVWYPVNFNEEMWKGVMTEKYEITNAIGDSLSSLIQNEDFTTKGNNYNSARSIDKAVNMIIHGVPTPYEDRVKPLLDVQVKNPFNKLVILPDGTNMEPGDKISWLDLAKLKRKK